MHLWPPPLRETKKKGIPGPARVDFWSCGPGFRAWSRQACCGGGDWKSRGRCGICTRKSSPSSAIPPSRRLAFSPRGKPIAKTDEGGKRSLIKRRAKTDSSDGEEEKALRKEQARWGQRTRQARQVRDVWLPRPKGQGREEVRHASPLCLWGRTGERRAGGAAGRKGCAGPGWSAELFREPRKTVS